ncbi:unnamed protein product [Gongylonema pulchrum]|uniref:SKICH domain-containing protein n=1 Tax=Gongylonema pulchrum TaxID=637853 RepID=A0A183D2I8_9BILA|nr:unnamed protein product [Gongylonema pulchrum]
MEIVHFDLLDHNPIREYEFFVQMFGSTDHVQVQTQTGDDNMECYCQTDGPERETIWTQIPYSDTQGWGTVSTVDASSYQHLNVEDPELKHYKTSYFHKERFRRFISTAGQVYFYTYSRLPVIYILVNWNPKDALGLEDSVNL